MELKSKLAGEYTTLADTHKALSYGLEWLLALRRDKDQEVSRKILEDTMTTEVYRTWTERVSKVAEEVTSLNEKYENKRKSKCLLWDNGLKREIKIALTEVLELVENCPEKILADYKQLERVIKEIGVPSIAEYPTLDRAFQEILDLLRQGSNNGVKCVALHGQRGVGKTTIMQNLNNHFYYKDSVRFEMVIFIRVAAHEQTDERTEGLHILQQIAQRIKVDEQGDESQVARRIQTVLKHKIYLLILDGVRYQLALEGIWGKLDISKHKRGSKVVITTHYPLPLKARCVDRAVELKPLSTDEEWKMFRDIAGNNLSLDIPKASMVCKRFCLFLPMLICPIASSFKYEEPCINWQRALSEYTSWAEVEGLEEIYSNLKISYQRLKGQSEKKCFLYASLYPANTKIYTRYFVECCKVQGFLGDDDATPKYSEMRWKAIHETLTNLVNVALLEEGEQMRYVKMNDLCRGFALHISKDSNAECKIYVDNEKHEEPSRSESWQNARWVSMVGSERDCLPSGRNFWSLETLLLQKNLKLVHIPKDCFDSMENLLVLNLYGTKIKKLPDLSGLTRLKVLYLNDCSDLQIDLSQIQLLEHLEVLDIRSTRANFVPRLISLQCLRISYTPKGNYDGISELHNLEELTIDIEEQFQQQWNNDSGHIEQKVGSLKNLTTLTLKPPMNSTQRGHRAVDQGDSPQPGIQGPTRSSRKMSQLTSQELFPEASMSELTAVESHIMASSVKARAVSTAGSPVVSPVRSTVASPVVSVDKGDSPQPGIQGPTRRSTRKMSQLTSLEPFPQASRAEITTVESHIMVSSVEAPAVSTVGSHVSSVMGAPIVHHVVKKLRSAVGIPSTSLKDIHIALNDGLEWLLASQRDKDREASRYMDEDTSNVYRVWTKSVSQIGREVASLNSKYEEAMGKKWKIWKRRRLKKKTKRELKDVVELLEKCPEEILADNLPERVIKGTGVPSIEEYPTLKKALQDIQALLRDNDGVKCVALEGQEGLGSTIIMQHLNDHFCDNEEFELVIFIKVGPDERTDIQILQKIADRVKVNKGGDEHEISGRIQRVLKDKRYLLILDGIKNPPDGIWEKLDISKDERDSKLVIATHYLLASTSKYVHKHVQLKPLSPHEAWNMFGLIVGDKTAQLASPREGDTSSSKSTTTISKLDQLVQYMLSLMGIWSFLHLILSYPIRIGHEEFLKHWINDVYQLCFADDDDDDDAEIDSLRRRVEYLLSESPLRYVQSLIPKEILNCGSVSTEKPSEYVPPQPILLLAAHLAVHQLTQTLTSDTIPYSQLPLKKIRSICFSTRNDAEKRTVVENIQANSQIRAAFDHVQIIDLNQIHDQTQRELELLSLESRLEQTAKNDRRSRHLVLVVDGDSDNKLDPQNLGLPITRDSRRVVVFITTLSSAQENDELSKKADLTIKTEDHLLPWEVFCKIVGSELLQSNIDIQEIAVKILKKCGGHLLAVVLMAESLKHEIDVQIWELALEKLSYRDREAIVNALFHIIWANVSSETEMIRLLRCLKVFQFKDLMMSDDQLFARWFSQQLVESEEEAKSILQNFMGCSVLLRFEGPLGRYILLPEDIKIILHALGEEFPENLREEALESTISDLQVFNLSYADMQNLYAISTLPQLKELNLEGCGLETIPQAIFKLQKLETLSLAHCSHLRELSSQIDKLENLKELRLAGCEQLKTLPEAIFKLQKLETLCLEHCSQLQELSPQIVELENLKELRLAGCEQLKTLPEAMFKLQKLETLSFDQCWQLLELSPHIAELENLKDLRLAGCKKLKTLPEAIFKLQKLETLSLEQCSHLQELSLHIAKLENLKELRLAGCKQLKTLPQEIWELPNLQTLSLAGTSIFPTSENQELINSDNSLPLSSSRHHAYSGHGKKDIPSSSSAIIQNGFILKLKVHEEFMKFEQLCQKIMRLQIQNLEICDLSGTNITDPPKVLNFPKLKSLLLGNNLDLIEISSSFFDHVPLLNILNLSRTSIHELPSSIFNLQELKEFYLKDCELLRELPQEISRLRNLTTLDLDGTLITHLPKDIQWLNNLESLSLSFYNESNHGSSFEVIPLGVLSQLTNLKVLRISVNPDNEWWFQNFEHILAEINGLKMLQALDIYIPRVNFLNPIERGLSNFRFIIGHHKPRIISRVPPAIEVMFKESGRSLKFVNGEDFPNEVKSILSEAWAFFLDRHMKINNLTEFGLKNLKQLRLCILAECNEMKSVIDVDEHEADSGLNESFCMQFLTIFYMKNMRSMINRPIFFELKLLALHTCPELTTIFTMDSLHSLVNLEELIVEDCPKVSSIINCPSSSKRTTDFFLPRLRKLSLLFVPELASISNGVCIGRNLEQMGLYNCPKLLSLSPAELSSEKLKVIRGETKWREELKWSEAEWGQEDPLHKFNQIFSPIDEDHGVFTQLTTYELMTSFKRENDSE